MSNRRKEVKYFLKELKGQVETLDEVIGKKHNKIYISVRDTEGNIVELPPIVMSKTPSCVFWRVDTTKHIKRILREHDIPYENTKTGFLTITNNL